MFLIIIIDDPCNNYTSQIVDVSIELLWTAKIIDRLDSELIRTSVKTRNQLNINAIAMQQSYIDPM